MGSPGSRERCFRTCSRSLTAQGPNVSHDYDTFDIAFRTVPLRRHPGISGFRGSILGPYVPLSTLQPCHYCHSRMTRGQCGSLLLQLYESFIHYTFPVLIGALGTSRNPQPKKGLNCYKLLHQLFYRFSPCFSVFIRFEMLLKFILKMAVFFFY
jgi:hypothetical protein